MENINDVITSKSTLETTDFGKSEEENETNEIIANIKANIKTLIGQGMLNEAKEAIQEYETCVEADSDIYCIKGVISVMENNYKEAEEAFLEGLLKDSNNCDLLYNVAHFYKNAGFIDKFIFFYKKLYYITKSQDDKVEVEKELNALGVSLKNKVLVGSPIHQKPEILKQFLLSLDELDKDNIEVHYFFVDDNKTKKSSLLLESFASENPNVIIKKSNYNDDYFCDKNTHNWNVNLINKVAKFKDEIIKYAKYNFYDYLFFLDSDLVLNPNTLKHLISTGKDIVSEIFWTKWNPDSLEMPQVWLKDQYDIYKYAAGEVLSDVEKQKRSIQFINDLRVPGIYEVGGLGACTLISGFALDKGVSFREIKNISFWGEDRHFCVRAAALGLSLYVDTHYPAYHIYRDSDLDGVKLYKYPNSNNLNLKKIALITNDNSGCNSKALYKQIPDYILNEFEVELISGSDRERINNYEICISTHYNSQYGIQKTNIDLFHGFPLKTMGVMNEEENRDRSKFYDIISNNIDFCISYSNLYTFLMSSCTSLKADKFKITGAPRNDLLTNENSKKILEELIHKDLKNKTIIFYVPTFRKRYAGDGSIIEDGSDFDEILSNFKDLDEFFSNNNIHLVVKKHAFNSERWSVNESENVSFLTNEMLYNNDIDSYDILGASDMLITDYSSVYFDYLLLDRPIIFFSKDLEEYRTNRGLLLEPYEFWTPGPKALNYEELTESISKFLLDKSYYSKERETIRNIAHHYKDFDSRQRVWKEIYNYIKTLS